MFCVKCGKEVEDGALFCPNCGTAVQSVKAEDSEMPNQKDEEMSCQKEINKKGMNKKHIAVIAVSVLVVCLCIAIFSMIGGSKAPDVVGQWKDLDDPSLLFTLNEDKTGTLESGGWAYNFPWDYNSSSHKLTLYVLGKAGTLTYNPVKDTISGNGTTLVRVNK